PQQRDPWDQLPGTAPAQPQHRGQGKGRRRYEDYDAMRGPAPAPRWADSHDDGNDDWGQWHGTAQPSHGQASWGQSGGDWSYAQHRFLQRFGLCPALALTNRTVKLTPSERVITEIRYVRCKNGELRPVFKHSSGSVCCAIACQISSCDYGRPPCAKQIHEPWDKDIHEVHRCSKCKQAGKTCTGPARPALLRELGPAGTLVVVIFFGAASLLWLSLQPCKDPTQHCLAVVATFRPSTLERYLRVAAAWVLFLECSGIALAAITLPSLLDFLAAARASHSQDREVHQTSAASSVKALRWVVKCAQWHSLAVAMDSPVIRAYSLRGTAKDRREALPIPWALISAWEFHVCTSGAPLTTKLILGAILLAVHGCLRFGDLQRIDFESLSLSRTALHGICYATKTTDKGQPFAVTLAGLTGRSTTASCWVLHWLHAMRTAIDSMWSPGDVVDFVWLSTAPELNSILELSPASYCTAMLALRWAATLPWLPPGQGLTAHEAAQLTLHSMKPTGLASAAQLRLWKEHRLTHGHHRDSAALYSRNDVFASLDVQHSLSDSMCAGWRAERSIARGGQAPIPEPPFALPPGPVLEELPAQDLLDPRWVFFVTRHEHLHAAAAATVGAPAEPQPPSPDDIEDCTQIKDASGHQASATHCDDGDPIEDFTDEEAAMVARAAALHTDDTSSAESSVSSDHEPEHRVPLIIDGDQRFACTGPWGKWHRVAMPQEGVPLRTACGIRLGVAAQFSDQSCCRSSSHSALGLFGFVRIAAVCRCPALTSSCFAAAVFSPLLSDLAIGPLCLLALHGMSHAWDSAEAFADLLRSLQVPDQLSTALQDSGIRTIPDFAFAYHGVESLDRFCGPDFAQLWQDLEISDAEHSPAMARLRRALLRAKALTQASDAVEPSAPAQSQQAQSINSWAEHAPPRLDSAVIAKLVTDFDTNYPGEYLDSDAMPSVKMLRTEAQFLSTALFDETPELPVDHLRLSPAWLSRIQAVFRNAIALCKGAHLARIKAFDKKVLDWATQSPADHSLRTVTTTELVAADRKLWQELSTMHSSGWTLDDALHEITTVRSDIGNLLQLRAKPPPPPQKPPPRAEVNKGKGKGKDKTNRNTGTQPGKRSSPGSGTSTEIKDAALVPSHNGRIFCIRYNKGNCRNAQCKYLHACAFKLPSGEPCGRFCLYLVCLCRAGSDSQQDSQMTGVAPPAALQASTDSEESSSAEGDQASDLAKTPPRLGALSQPDSLARLFQIVWSGILGSIFVISTACALSDAEHSQARALLRAAHLQGAHVNFLFPCQAEQPLQSAYTHLCQEIASHCRECAAFGPSTVFCSSDCSLEHFEVPRFLPRHYKANCSALGHADVALHSFQQFLPSTFHPVRVPTCDVAGLFSSADHAANNVSTKAQPLAKLAQDMSKYLKTQGLESVIAQHLAEAKEGAPLSDYHGTVLAELVRLHVETKTTCQSFFSVAPGQPFRLQVLKSIAVALQDRDRDLPDLLAEGVPTGAFEPLPSSHQWVQVQHSFDSDADFSGPALEHCRGNWLAAEQEPALLDELIQKEIDNGWVKEFVGSAEEAAKHWHLGTAIGTLHSIAPAVWQQFYDALDSSARSAPRMHCLSAADAFADKGRMGIGGWLSTAQHFIWYSEIFTAEQVRAEWPQLTGSLQPYIGCFETLAQLALAQCSWQLLRARHVRFVLPSASDNTSAESGLNKLFSTAEPLGTFLRLAATWAHLHRVQFEVEHLAGEKNTWADALSRGRIAFINKHRSAERTRVSLTQLASASHSVSLH
ncbi:mfsd7-A, partial [Symbiodinium sp. CCMP2456]